MENLMVFLFQSLINTEIIKFFNFKMFNDIDFDETYFNFDTEPEVLETEVQRQIPIIQTAVRKPKKKNLTLAAENKYAKATIISKLQHISNWDTPLDAAVFLFLIIDTICEK